MKAKLNIVLSIFILTIISISIISCKKTDDEKPVITLSTPVSEQDYAIGDTIFISGHVSDNEALHELEIRLTKEETGETPFTFTPTVHDLASYHIDTFYIPSDTVHIHYHLKIEAWDHDNNEAELEYTLHWND